MSSEDNMQDVQSNVPILNIPNPGIMNNSSTNDNDSVMESEEESLLNQSGDAEDGRSGKLTLTALLQEGLVEPGEGVMSIDYLGQTFKGDLLSCGKIKSQETGLVFSNPSAWAISCKKIVNPAKKSGCGWASVKYKGKKMDYYKNIWSKNKALKGIRGPKVQHQNGNASSYLPELEENNVRNPDLDPMSQKHIQRMTIKHSQLSAKNPLDDKDVLIEVDSFESIGKIQPFNISISSSALLLIDLHSHLSQNSVCGYLAGHWDLNAHNLAVTHTFPCLTADSEDPEKAKEVETDIYNKIYGTHLAVVGWYKTVPGHRALPSIKDSENQLDYQIKMLGNSDATYSPCVGMAVSPYKSGSSESEILTYWVAPPPENIYPPGYGKPLLMNHSVVIDPCLSQELLDQIEQVILFYNNQDEKIPFKSQYNSDTKYITKMGRTLLPKFPRDQDERLWKYIRVLILGEEEKDIDDPLTVRLTSQHHQNGKHNGTNGRKYNRRKTNESLEEEEIDDDEENALKSYSQRNGHHHHTAAKISRKRSSATSQPRTSTDSVSVVPIPASSSDPPRLPETTITPAVAHSQSMATVTPIQEVSGAESPRDLTISAPLDYSKCNDESSSGVNRGEVQDDDSDDDRLMIQE